MSRNASRSDRSYLLIALAKIACWAPSWVSLHSSSPMIEASRSLCHLLSLVIVVVAALGTTCDALYAAPSQDRISLQSVAGPDSTLRGTRFSRVPPWTDAAPAGSLSESTPCLEWSTLTQGEHLYRIFSMVVHDPSRHRAMRFGGTNWGSGGLENDVWVQDLDSTNGWVLLETAGTPPPQSYGNTAIYDPVRDRLIVSGGFIGSCYPEEGEPEDPCYTDDVWALSLSGTPTWQQIAISGPTPGQSVHGTAIYDPVRDRMIVTGAGADESEVGATWALSLATSTWTLLTDGPVGPWAVSFYDPSRDRMWLLQGHRPGTVWSLDLAPGSAWVPISTTGTLPVGGERSAIAYDPVRDRAYLLGGTSPGVFHNDLWELTLAGIPTWQLVSASNPPPPRWNVVGIYDEIDEQFLIFGGSSANAWGDTWRFPVMGPPEWSRLFPVEGLPTVRDEQGAVWDAPRRRMIVFGGQGSEGDALNDLYSFDVSGVPTWTRLEAAGPSPRIRVSMSAIADAHDRMILFGGRSGRAVPDYAPCLGDVWTLTLNGPPVWTPLAPTGIPPIARTSHSAVYDRPRNRMIVFGGNDSTGTYLNDTWALDLNGGGAWQQLTPAGTLPPATVAATAVYDPLRDCMLVIGGSNKVIGALNTVWELSLAGAGEWTLLTPEGPPPPPMVVSSAVYDPLRDRVLVYGDVSPMGHVDVLSLSGTPTWSVASVVGPKPVARVGHSAAFDSTGDRMIVFGGVDFQEFVYLNDALALSVASDAVTLTTAVSPSEAGTIARDPVSVCFDSGATATLTALPASGYRFTEWSGDASGTTNPMTIHLGSSKHVVAHFETDVTATLVSRFEARSVPQGIELLWQLGTPDHVASVALERALAANGPWDVVSGEHRGTAAGTVALDNQVAPGATYWYHLQIRMLDGTVALSDVLTVEATGVLTAAIRAVTPNPTSGLLRVQYALARSGSTEISVVDIAGRRVATLLNAERKPGNHVLDWDVRTARLRGGLYFIRLSSGDRTHVRRVVIVE